MAPGLGCCSVAFAHAARPCHVQANRPPCGGFEVDGKRVPTPADTIRPWWTPPGIAFPFIWLTITGLRAISSMIVFKACGRTLFSPPLLLLALHLAVGDTWNR